MPKKKMLTGAGIAATAAVFFILGSLGVGPAFAAQTPPTNTPTIVQSSGEQTEAPEDASQEAVEAGEPSLPGGGHADASGVDVQHEFDGIE